MIAGIDGRLMKCRIVVLAGVLAVGSPTWASEAYGQVLSLWVRDSDGLTYVTLDRNPTTPRPACAAATPYYMIAREDSAVGKRQYAILLAAKIAGKAIYLTGRGTCVRWGDGEDIDTIRLAD